jgi:hypothetical protein
MVSRAESLNIEHVYIAGALGSFRKANDASTAYRSYQENASTKFPPFYQNDYDLCAIPVVRQIMNYSINHLTGS